MPTIIPYQNHWPAEFTAIASILRTGLGGYALRIDHIGSTSVPRLAAKDIIDIQITIPAFDPAIKDAIKALGYTQPAGIWRDHCPPAMQEAEHDWAKWLFKPPHGQRPNHTHVRVIGRPNQRYPLLFRDYLRVHPASAEAYGQLKIALAANLADPGTYPEVKDPAVDLIFFAAEAWAEATHWQPGPSDA